MRVRMIHMLALAVCVGLTGCDASDVLGPIQPADVTITLALTGGFAGFDYVITIDGAAREVRGVRCASFCDFQPGEVIVAVSSEQVVSLARALDEAGALALDGRDYGTECCDQFYFDLTYLRGERSSHVRGTQSLLPEDLQSAITHILPLARRIVPLLVAPDMRDTDGPRDSYTLGDVEVSGLELTAQVTYGGGCAAHRMDLVAWGGWMESFPVQVNALITHDDGDDPCDAILTEERRFDLTALARAYTAAYGSPGTGRATVVLRLRDPGAAGPRLLEISF